LSDSRTPCSTTRHGSERASSTASVYKRGYKWWARIKDAAWKWIGKPTPYTTSDPLGKRKAKRAAELAQNEVDRQRTNGPVSIGVLTVRAYAKTWIAKRREADLDWKNDEGRLKYHVLPIIGDTPIADVNTPALVQLFQRIRTGKERPVAGRTVHNIYSVVSALFRDAKLDGVIEQSPCCLDERQLGPKRDKDPAWRKDAVFTRDEVETLISSPLIPHDRRVAYAIELLAGVRPGEAAALRWEHYDAAKEPLGEMFVAFDSARKRTARRARRRTRRSTCRCTRRSRRFLPSGSSRVGRG
jgi:integrase